MCVRWLVEGCGAGVVDVGIVDPKGGKLSVRPVITKKSPDLWYVEYTALMPGLHSVNVFFAGKQINNSPFAVGVAAGNNVYATSISVVLGQLSLASLLGRLIEYQLRPRVKAGKATSALLLLSL